MDGFTFLKTNYVSTHGPCLTDLAGINSPILQLDSKRCWFGHNIVRITMLAGVCGRQNTNPGSMERAKHHSNKEGPSCTRSPLWEIIWIFSVVANLIADKSFFSMFCSLPNDIISIRGSRYCMYKTPWKDQEMPVADKASDYLKARQMRSNAC